jgi:gamma-glutamylcyclotransferase (GGCT)/AIG2-like uncharacterized protein YtfP
MIGRYAHGCQLAAAVRYIWGMHVFTYGTLMFPEIWQAVAGRPSAAMRGKLDGFAIYRVRGQLFPGILAASPADVVPGVVYLDVGPEALRRLDQFEDDFYERQAVTVHCDDGQRREAQSYVVPHGRSNVLTTEGWSADEFIARGDLERFVQRFPGFRRLATDAD